MKTANEVRKKLASIPVVDTERRGTVKDEKGKEVPAVYVVQRLQPASLHAVGSLAKAGSELARRAVEKQLSSQGVDLENLGAVMAEGDAIEVTEEELQAIAALNHGNSEQDGRPESDSEGEETG
jgi:hypothetical protein